MAPSKPRGVKQGSWVEQQIRQAQRAGEFDDLPGAGKPLERLSEARDPLWWAKSWVRREGLSVVPPELELRKQVEKAFEKIETMRSEKAVRKLLSELNAEIGKRNATVTSGPATSIAQIDIGQAVEAWSLRRAGLAESKP